VIVGTTTANSSTDLFRQAYEEIKDMLEGRKTISFKKAVFLVDNAYMGGLLNWNWYEQEIKNKLPVFDQMINSTGYGRYRTSKNWAIHTFMTDTTKNTNGLQYYQYDYENNTNDTTGLVYHLLETHLGNCRSLPLLYKIWCDEYGASAFLAIAPMHIYVQQQDENGIWWNIELTSFYKYMPSEDYIAIFGITDAARQSGLYMKPLTERENLILCLEDLLRYYVIRKDIVCDPFVEELTGTILKYQPVSEVQLMRFSCLKHKLDNEMRERGLYLFSQIEMYPDLVEKWKELEKLARYIDGIGYRKVSEEQYQALVNQSKQKAEIYFKNKQ
jgi:hypothetical protein